MSLTRYLSSLISSSCLLCRGAVRGLKPLCRGCEQELPWITTACPHCALPMPVNVGACAACLHSPPLFDRALCALRYEAPVSTLLNRYKHSGQLAGGHWLAYALAQHIKNSQWLATGHQPDCLMPIPLHWWRLRQRGFDQGREITRVLARELSLPWRAGLRRQRNTASQQGLSRAQRQHNLDGAFTLHHTVQGQRIVLVDDVLTTGSTATEITRLLRDAGAIEVQIWAIARTL